MIVWKEVAKLGVGVVAAAIMGKVVKREIKKPKLTYSQYDTGMAERKLAGIRKELRKTRISINELKNNPELLATMKEQEAKLMKDEAYYENVLRVYDQEVEAINKYMSENKIF